MYYRRGRRFINNKMVFSLKHDIKVPKNHQNLLPTQSVIVAHTVYFQELFSLILLNQKKLFLLSTCTVKELLKKENEWQKKDNQLQQKENELLLKIKEYECQITIFETQLVS
jgi:hypothetical protein